MTGSGGTVRQLVSEAEALLTERGVDSPRLSAQLLMAAVLGLERPELILSADRILSSDEAARFRAFAARRSQGEPLAYILGEKEFYGLAFAVNPHVLIPRPETELIVDRALALFDLAAPLRFADLGTGSGCLAVTIAVHFPKAVGVALDISPGALATARENARRHGVSERLTFLEGDFSLLGAQDGPFDLIVSNPPYVTESEMRELSHEVAVFEPHGALASGPDGLLDINKVAAIARETLRPGGVLLMEMGWTQGPAAHELLTSPPVSFASAAILKDLAGLDRVAEARA